MPGVLVHADLLAVRQVPLLVVGVSLQRFCQVAGNLELRPR
jgi:hypothetical protein